MSVNFLSPDNELSNVFNIIFGLEHATLIQDMFTTVIKSWHRRTVNIRSVDTLYNAVRL